ncbi:MAG: Na+/H+ antiporter subunit E, partial [Hyphomicrobiaceae bacterium]
MRRWLPYPIIAAMLLATWLLLYETMAISHILLGGALAVGGSWVLLRLDVPPHIFKRFRVIVRLLLEVAVDMTRSNIRVASLIFQDKPDRRPGFVRIELRVRSQYALAVLACIITATPGTS